MPQEQQHTRPEQPLAPDAVPIALARRVRYAVDYVPYSQIRRDDRQLRRIWGAESRKDKGRKSREQVNAELDAMAASIQAHGILEPLLVRQDGDEYVIVAGVRRYVAAGRAGLDDVPVIVQGGMRAHHLVVSLVENLQREDLDPLDAGRAFIELMEIEGITANAVAQRVHCSAQHVRDCIRIYNDAIIRPAVETGQISKSVAREVFKLPDDVQDELRRRIKEGRRITPEVLAAIRQELQTLGITNPRAPHTTAGAVRGAGPEAAEPAPPATRAGGDAATPARGRPPVQSESAIASTLADDLAAVHSPVSQKVGIPAQAPARVDPLAAIDRRTGDRIPYGRNPADIIDRAESRVRERREIAAPLSAAGRSGPLFGSVPVAPVVAPTVQLPPVAETSAAVVAAIEAIDWDVLRTILDYGVGRGWSCAGLLNHALAVRQGRTGTAAGA